MQGERLDRPPVALWRHFPVDDQSPESLAQATLHFQSLYDFDLVKVTPASSFSIKDWGVEDDWRGHTEGTRQYTKRVIHEPQDWEKLPVLDASAAHLAGQIACLRLIRAGLDPETPLLQTVFSPLAMAKNLAGNETLISHWRLHPEAVMKGLETITKSTIKFIEAVHEIGADGIFYAIQHAQGRMLELDEYKSIALPYDQQALGPAEEFWCNLLHLHGKDVYFSLLRLMNFQIVNWHDRETYPSLVEAQSVYHGVVCGGIRQDTLYSGSPVQVKEEAVNAIQQTKGKRFILGTGCVVYYQSPHENIMAAIESTR